MRREWESLQRRITRCEECPRLVEHCRKVAVTRKKMYADQEYWGRPVPTFGPPDARLLVLGLAPAAHGANRTGRMFTGDSSGDWLYEALHRFGFATRATSTSADDGLELVDCAITASAHCAPPDNRPTRAELDTCRKWLHEEVEILRPEVVIVLGRIAWETWWKVLDERGVALPRPRPGFAHGQWIEIEGQAPVLQSYHPSRQNTNTGRLTRPAWHSIFRKARGRLG
jgi:uracil-DNA glycosylase family 4